MQILFQWNDFKKNLQQVVIAKHNVRRSNRLVRLVAIYPNYGALHVPLCTMIMMLSARNNFKYFKKTDFAVAIVF